jgi:co-chaperonin GroES (HSP10)
MADGATPALDQKFLGEELPPMDWIPDPDRFYLLITQVGIKTKSSGGILLPGTTVSDQEWNHGLGLVVKVGPAVYRGKRFEDMGLHPSEGPKPGDLVLFQARTPNRIKVEIPGGGDRLFLEIADDAILGRVQREHMHRIKFQVG